jgi:hypothetical protein
MAMEGILWPTVVARREGMLMRLVRLQDLGGVTTVSFKKKQDLFLWLATVVRKGRGMAFVWVKLEVRGVEMLMLHLPGAACISSVSLSATNQADISCSSAWGSPLRQPIDDKFPSFCQTQRP